MIIIPLGGVGQRFKNKYNIPKALIKVYGKPIIFWLLDNLSCDEVLIPYNKEYEKYDFENILREKYPSINFIFLVLQEQTRGAAETLKLAIEKYMEKCSNDIPVFSIDADNFYLENIVELWDKKNKVIVFEDKNNKPLFSYVKVDKYIVEIKEKEKISNYANCGAYGFESIKTLYKYCCKIIDNDIRFKDEFYISTVIAEMIKDNINFEINCIDTHKYISLGTPEQVSNFENLTFLFDLDGTLVITDNIYLDVWKSLLSKFGLCVDEAFFNNFIKGKSDCNFLKFLIPGISDQEILEISNEKDDKFIELLVNDRKNILIDGAIEFLEKIKNNNIAIVTNCNKKSAEFIIKYCSLEKYANLLITANDCNKPKPDAEPYVRAMNLLKADIDRTVIFEDSETGLLSARRSNITNIVLLIKDDSNEDLLNNNYYKIKNYNEINFNKILFKNVVKKDKYEDLIKNELSFLPVKNVKINPISLKTGYICDIFCYDLIYNSGEDDSIVLKISNLENELSKTATKLDMYNLEVYFYKNLSHIVGNFIEVPKSYGIIYDGEKKGIIMENLRNYTGQFNINLETNIKMLLKVVNKIYIMHNIFYFNNENELIDVVKPLKTANKIYYYSELIRNRFDKFIKKNNLFLTVKEKNILTNIYNSFDKIQNELSQFPLSLCHGDLKSPNIFYKSNKSPVFLDWQYIHLNKGVSDISFLMIESIKFDENICNLVLNYYFQLINEGKRKISREEYMRDFRNSICNFPFFVCIWFNSEDSEKLLDKTFPIRFMKNLLKYYEYYL